MASLVANDNSNGGAACTLGGTTSSFEPWRKDDGNSDGVRGADGHGTGPTAGNSPRQSLSHARPVLALTLHVEPTFRKANPAARCESKPPYIAPPIHSTGHGAFKLICSRLT